MIECFKQLESIWKEEVVVKLEALRRYFPESLMKTTKRLRIIHCPDQEFGGHSGVDLSVKNGLSIQVTVFNYSLIARLCTVQKP
jgi:hypothetical protein